MGLRTLIDSYSEATPKSYRWYVGLYCDFLEKNMPRVSRSDKLEVIGIFRRLRDEHTINWSRNRLYEFEEGDVADVRRILLRTVHSTDRYDVMKAALYLLRNLRRNRVVDDHVLRCIPDLKTFVDYRDEATPGSLQERVLSLPRGEHSLRDLEALFIGNRGFVQVMTLREEKTRVPRYHPTDMDSVELLVTEDCNLKCLNCDKMCRKAESSDSMSLEQVRKFVSESVDAGKQWKRIGISGGEPTTHPDIIEIVGELLEYRNRHLPKTSFVQVSTNGYRESEDVVREILSKFRQDVLPSSDSTKLVRDNSKRNKVVLHSPVNMAPIDGEGWESWDFRNGCWVPKSFGMGLSRNGYYCCGTSSAIDRVFGHDVGIKTLRDVNMKAFLKQRSVFCKLCGRFNDLSIDAEHYSSLWVIEEKVSMVWQRAFEYYRTCRPRLTLY
jgi:hypothetical protein